MRVQPQSFAATLFLGDAYLGSWLCLRFGGPYLGTGSEDGDDEPDPGSGEPIPFANAA